MLRKTVKALCFVLLSATVLITCGCAGGSNAPKRPDEQPLLANKEHPLTATYAPAGLTDIPADLTLYGKEIRMESEAAAAAVQLLRALHDAGYTDIVITSGYRTYEYQQTLFYTYVANEQKAHPDWSRERCEQEVVTYSALPGTSEHQTGLCMDLISVENVVLDESFAKNPVYAYLQENAHLYGFILRYPEGKEDVTGYTYEPWHYRYVGVAVATYMKEVGASVTLEDYLAGA